MLRSVAGVMVVGYGNSIRKVQKNSFSGPVSNSNSNSNRRRRSSSSSTTLMTMHLSDDFFGATQTIT